MWKQCGCLVLLSAVLALIPGGAAYGAFDILKDPALIGWWSCDDGTGTTVADSSSNKRNGTVVNGTAIWVPGIHGGAIELKGPVLVKIPPINMTMTQGTMAGWLKRIGSQPDWSSIIMHRATGTATNASGFNLVGNNLAYHWQDASNTWSYRPGSAAAIPNNEWTFCAVTVEPTRAIFYLNGNPVGTNYVTHATANWNADIYLGGDGNYSDATRRLTDGLLDDVSFFSRALSASEIKDIMKLGLATTPAPARSATDVPQDAALAWTADPSAGTHDVYFGTVQADVDAASRTDKKGVLVSQGQTDATFKPTLEYGKTYYWRVDEVSKDNTILKGGIWSFTVEPYGYSVTPTKATASSAQASMGPENTINNSGMTGDLHGNVETTMWLTTGAAPNWIQYEFDKVYRLHEMYVWNSNQQIEMMLGFGAKTVTVETSVDGTTWAAVKNVPEFARAPGTAGYAANTTVSLGVDAKFVKLTITANWGGLAPQTGLSEVRFSYAPVQARSPVPADKSTGAATDAKLDWRPGRGATSHKVFFSTDQAAVAAGTVAAKTVANHGFDPGALILATPYYWKVDEVGAATYPGSVWSFTTRQYKPIDDFESYTDAAGGEIFSAWVDGYSSNFKSSGSTVGNRTSVKGTFSETTILHGGSQSMPFDYNNTKAPFFSEATRTFATPQDWTVNGANTLDLWFKGFPAAYLQTATGVTMSGAGGDIYNTTVECRYAYKQLTGDGSITVRVDSVRPVAAWSKSGVMIRASLDPLDMHVHLISAAAQNLVEFMYRSAAKATTTTQFNAPAGTNPLPVWLRLTRAGDVFTGETSTDGTTWAKLTVGTNVSTQTLSMPATVYVGFVVDAGATTGQMAVADFSQISTTGNVSAGSWQVANVGPASQPSNSPAPMYLVVEDKDGKKATVVNPNPAAVNVQPWTDWKIAFSDLKGVNVAAVKKLTIGVGDGKTTGTGKLYIDDIQFGRVPTPVDPGQANLVALWTLDGDAKDSSGKGNNGTVNGPTVWVPGYIGQALQFNGSSTWVDCGTGTSLNLTEAVTITAWIRLAVVGGDRKIAGNQDNVGGGYKMGVYSTNKVELEIRTAANTTTSNRSAAGGTVLQAGSWYHVAAVYLKGQYFRTYVLGNLDRETTTTAAAGSSTVSFKLGRETYGTGGTWWYGALDDVRVYNKALSQEELLWLASK